MEKIPHELPPAATTQFFGRTAQVEQLVARLQNKENAAVIGLAGMGKTALAAKAVETVVGQTPESLANSPFPAGVVFVDFYTFKGQADPAWHMLANKLAGANFQETRPARDRATEACRGRNMLLIIEGGEEANGKEGRSRIADFLSICSHENRSLLLTRDSSQATPAETVRLDDVLNPEDAGNLFDALTVGLVTGAVRDRILTLLEGHPLALTWAGNLLARGDEDPARLASEWESQTLKGLSDPVQAEHTLQWLFDRSVRGLDGTAQDALTAAGLLGRAPFPVSAIEAAIGSSAREALRQLTQRGLLRLTTEEDHREFTHVLGYRFARMEKSADTRLRCSLGTWLHQHLASALAASQSEDLTIALARPLQHATALLKADYDQQLWAPLGEFLMYEGLDRLLTIGRLDLSTMALEAVSNWFNNFPTEKNLDSYWQRENSVCLNKLGDLAQAQGNLSEARQRHEAALGIREHLAQADPANTEWQRDLSISFEKLGDLAQAQGNLSEARQRHEAALGIREHLAQADPNNVMWQQDVEVSRRLVSEVRANLNK
jgi:tetratricopeptide (TPR) repeat protein